MYNRVIEGVRRMDFFFSEYNRTCHRYIYTFYGMYNKHTGYQKLDLLKNIDSMIVRCHTSYVYK